MKTIGKFMLLAVIVVVGLGCEPNGGVTAPKRYWVSGIV